LEFPSGSRVTLANLSHRRALEIARKHESELQLGAARLDLGEAESGQQVERIKAFAVDVLTRVPASSLLPKTGAASAQQFIIYNGPTYSPVMTGPLAQEETMGDKITISDVQGSIVNVKSKFEQVSQSIGTAPIDAAKKDELKRLVQQLHESLQTVT